MNRRDASTSCWRHPSQRGAGAGVCADCLKERLSALSPTTPPHRSSFGASASTSSSTAHHLVKQSGSNPHHVLSPLVSDAYLRRSKSCSAAGGSTLLSRHPNRAPGEVVQPNAFGGGRKSDAVLDDWTRQRFFSILAKDQKLSSSSNFRGTTPFPDRLRHPTNSSTNKAAVDQPVSTTSTLSSRTVLLENASSSSTRNQNQQREPDNIGASTGSTKKPRKWLSLLLNFKFRRSKTTRKEVSEDHEQARQDRIDLIKQGSSSRNRFKQLELWPPSPLRFFSQAKKQSKAKSVAVQDEDYPQLQRSSWSTPPSSSDTKKQSYTTAYYRDYGGWSLSSSPVPNGKPSAAAVRGSNSKQSSRPEFVSSPYHRAAAAAAATASPSTWNFYLTPLRLAKATTSSSSKHRY